MGVFLLLLACSSPDRPRPMRPETTTSPSGPRDLHVVVWPDLVRVYHDSSDDCFCATNWPPLDDEILAYIDAANCSCDPSGCIDTISLVDDGVVVDSEPDELWEDLLDWGMEYFIPPNGDGLALRFEGCGDPVDIPLSSPSLTQPTGTSLWVSADIVDGALVWPVTLGVEWDTEPPAEESIALGFNWHDGWWRRESDTDPTYPYHPDWDEGVTPGILTTPVVHATAAGTISVAEGLWAPDLPSLTIPCPVGVDRWSLYHPALRYADFLCDTCPTLTVGGDEGGTQPTRVELRQGAGELLLTFEGTRFGAVDQLRYTAGTGVDDVALHEGNTWWVGTVPHEPLPWAFGALSTTGHTRALGDLVLEDEAAPGVTRLFTGVTLTWEPVTLVAVGEITGGTCL